MSYDSLPEQDNRSVGELISSLTGDLSTLFRQEVELAKAELRQSATQAGAGAGMLTGAGIAALFVLLFLSFALWSALSPVMGSALGAVLVAVLWAVIAAVLGLVGKSKLSKATPPVQQTAETVKQIPNALKGHEEENR